MVATPLAGGKPTVLVGDKVTELRTGCQPVVTPMGSMQETPPAIDTVPSTRLVLF
jgi:hypothetical protein